MKIKAGEINTILMGLNQVGDFDLPVKISYWFARTARELQSEIEVFEGQRIKLLKKYSQVDDKGELILDKDNQAQLLDEETFKEEYIKIADGDIELKMNKIDIKALEEVNIKPKIMSLLLPLIEDGNKE